MMSFFDGPYIGLILDQNQRSLTIAGYGWSLASCRRKVDRRRTNKQLGAVIKMMDQLGKVTISWLIDNKVPEPVATAVTMKLAREINRQFDRVERCRQQETV